MPAIAEEAKRATEMEAGDLAIEVVGKQVRIYEIVGGSKLKQIAYSDTFQRDRFLFMHVPQEEMIRAKDFTVARLYRRPEIARKAIAKYFPKYASAGAKAHLYYSGAGPRGRSGATGEGYFSVSLSGADESKYPRAMAAMELESACLYGAPDLINELKGIPKPKKFKVNKASREFKMGQRAFKDGKPNAPALNKTLMQSFKGKTSDQMMQMMTDYAAGWHAANLAAPVPEGLDEVAPGKIAPAYKKWGHADAATYATMLQGKFGTPARSGEGFAEWDNIGGADRVLVRDESIFHDFPAPHRDYVYSTVSMKVPEKLHSQFAKVTGSIIIDGLKQQVTARCHMLIANAVTLGFVEDVIGGKAKATKDEYAKRIKRMTTPEWFTNPLNESLDEAVRLTPAYKYKPVMKTGKEWRVVFKTKGGDNVEAHVSVMGGTTDIFSDPAHVQLTFSSDKGEEMGLSGEFDVRKVLATVFGFLRDYMNEYYKKNPKGELKVSAWGVGGKRAKIYKRYFDHLADRVFKGKYLEVSQTGETLTMWADSHDEVATMNERYDPKLAHDYVNGIKDRKAKAYAREYLKAIKGIRMPPSPEEFKITTQAAREVELGFKKIGAPLAASVQRSDPTFEQIARIVRRAKSGGFNPNRISLAERAIPTTDAEYIFLIHHETDDSYSVAHSVHDDPRLGYQELQTGLDKRAAEKMTRKLKTRWKKAKVRRLLLTGHGHKREWLPESDEEKTKRIKDTVDAELNDPANKGLTFIQVLRAMFKGVDDADEARKRVVISKLKDEVNYRRSEEDRDGDERCGNCAFIVMPDACQRVRGKIDQDFICDLFKRGVAEVDEATFHAQIKAVLKGEDVRVTTAMPGDPVKRIKVIVPSKDVSRIKKKLDVKGFKTKAMGTAITVTEDLDEATRLPTGPKLKNMELNLRRSPWAEKPGPQCEVCRYFKGPKDCAILKGPVDEYQLCDGIQGKESIPRYKISSGKVLAFVKGMVKAQPYQHKVLKGVITPVGPLLIIEDTMKPIPHRFSLPWGFSIEHTSREHIWTQKEVNRLIAIGGGRLKEDLDEAGTQGEVQAALLNFVKQLPDDSEVWLSDVTRRQEFRRVHFKRLMSAAKALEKKGLIWYDGMSAVGPPKA